MDRLKPINLTGLVNIKDLQVLMLLNSKEKCIKSILKSGNTFNKPYLD